MTKQIEDGGPAYPHPVRNEQCEWDVATGMTLRDWFAGQALAGIIEADGAQFFRDSEAHARHAYAHADAMLAARKEDAS